jgi:preprotein translocase subunit SecB
MNEKENNEKVIQAPFKFKSFFIAESNIKILPDTKAETIDISIDPKGLISEQDKTFEIQLEIQLSSDDGLKVSVKMIGLFEFKDVYVSDNLSNYFYVNAPAIIFPYLRSYISALTALSGCRTIIIPPMNIMNLGKDLERNTTIQPVEIISPTEIPEKR